MKSNNLLLRMLSGAVYVALITLSLLCSKEAFASLMFLGMLISLIEYFTITKKLSVSPQVALGIATAIVLFLASYVQVFQVLSNQNDKILLLVIPLITAIFFVELFRHKAKPFSNIAFTLLGLIYVAIPFALTNYIFHTAGAFFLLCFFIMLWANDSFAYVFGRAFGKYKLLARISPKKTWEGYIGGILSVAGFSYALHCIFVDIAWQHLLVVGFIVSITATLGDLVESMLKRSADVKDSGRIMPGHGGLLDRFDAALLSLPLVFVYVQLFVKP
ncbi:MAG: phosphatidate cytidylyltransferase [Bacteroidales bacterium]